MQDEARHETKGQERAQEGQVELRVERIVGLMNTLRGKLDTLEKTVKSLEDQISVFTTELSKTYKESFNSPAA